VSSGSADAAVVIPLLAQRTSWLDRALRSALEQGARPDVWVVVSPRTPPANLRLLESLAARSDRLHVAVEPPRGGFAAAINAGIEAAAAERVGLLLSDDWLEPGAVAACLDYDADIVSTGLTLYDASGKRALSQRRLTEAEYEALPTLESRACYLKHFFLFRRKAVLEVGGVDESVGLTGPDDYDLIWTLLERGATVALAPRPLYGYRDHDGPRLTLRSREEQIEDLRKILDKHGVKGLERRRLLEQRSIWYGRPMHATERLIGRRPG
jgi:GT2 family glycosyltransferase